MNENKGGWGWFMLAGSCWIPNHQFILILIHDSKSPEMIGITINKKQKARRLVIEKWRQFRWILWWFTMVDNNTELSWRAFCDPQKVGEFFLIEITMLFRVYYALLWVLMVMSTGYPEPKPWLGRTDGGPRNWMPWLWVTPMDSLACATHFLQNRCPYTSTRQPFDGPRLVAFPAGCAWRNQTVHGLRKFGLKS